MPARVRQTRGVKPGVAALFPAFFSLLLAFCSCEKLLGQDEPVWDDWMYGGEWGSLVSVSTSKSSRRNNVPGFEAAEFLQGGNEGVDDRESVIQEYLQSSGGSINENLVLDYAVEARYETSENVVVPRPTNSERPFDWNAYENMKIRLRNTKYNSVRPGPGAYFIPRNVSVLAQTVRELNAAGTSFVIRGGGHSYEANTLPSSEATVVIDMARFTDMNVSERDLVGSDGAKYRELTFGTGLRLATLYVYLAAKNLALVAGTCPANGSGGYYMGGGAGPAMRKVGWGSDQLIGAKVVLSNGELAVAGSDDSDALPGQVISPSELLFALRGGGSGTAIVYEYTVRAYHAPDSVARCRSSYSTTTKDAYQTYVKAWSDDWKIWQVDGARFPFIRLYSTNNVSRIVMDAWDTSTQDLADVMTQGMAGASSIQVGEPDCSSYSWPEFVYETFVSYYAAHPSMIENIGWKNFTTPYLLAMDYIGWGYAGADIPVAPPMSPYANFVAVAPTVNGPSSFTAQGILSSMPWSSAASGSLWDEAISQGSRFYSYVLGGRLDDDTRGAAFDDTIGSAMDSLSHGTILTVTDVPTSNQVAVDLAASVASVLDDLTVAKQPSRYYNFLNCYNDTTATLFNKYYGEEVGSKLQQIKQRADPKHRLKTWCDV
jgi:hypothetical protein